MTATIAHVAYNAAVVVVIVWWLVLAGMAVLWVRFRAEERRRRSPSASFDRAAEDAIRLVRPGPSQWQGWL